MMRRLLLALAVTALAIIPLSGCVYVQPAQGFTWEDLVAPAIEYVTRDPPELPSQLTTTTPTYSYSLRWSMTEVFAGFGGAMELWITNTCEKTLFVYGYGIRWVGSADVQERDASSYVEPEEEAWLGMLGFNGPGDAGPAVYSITLNVVVQTANGAAWHDYGRVTAVDRAVDVKPPIEERFYDYYHNSQDYFWDVNSRINTSAVESIVSMIRSEYLGEYSVHQIAAAYDWVRENIEYVSDNGGDYWQSVEETLEARGGDCEDHAILMASIVKALGGNARVNIISGHAFPTVFVGSDQNGVWLSLKRYYGTETKACFLTDEFGSWLVVDTTGFPYAGGLPAMSSPTNSTMPWTFNESDWLHSVDAVG